LRAAVPDWQSDSWRNFSLSMYRGDFFFDFGYARVSMRRTVVVDASYCFANRQSTNGVNDVDDADDDDGVDDDDGENDDGG